MKYLTKLAIFFGNDQPTTCPHCGRRTEIIAGFVHTNLNYQIQQCPEDQFIFLEEFDKDEQME